eukprot:8084476-Pyramimonas_sp.AAC.2
MQQSFEHDVLMRFPRDRVDILPCINYLVRVNILMPGRIIRLLRPAQRPPHIPRESGPTPRNPSHVHPPTQFRRARRQHVRAHQRIHDALTLRLD